MVVRAQKWAGILSHRPAKGAVTLAGFGALLFEVVVGLAEESGRADGAVVDLLTEFRPDGLNDDADERAGRVVLAAVAAGVDHVFDLAEDLADFVFDGLGGGSRLIELLEIREEGVVDEVGEVVGAHGFFVVDRAVGFLGGGPSVPAVGLGGVLEEEESGGLLGVVEFGGTAGFLAEGVVDVAEGFFELRATAEGRCGSVVVGCKGLRG